MYIVFKNQNSETVRVYPWQADKTPQTIFLVYRFDQKKLDLTFYPSQLDKVGVKYEVFKELDSTMKGEVFKHSSGLSIQIQEEAPDQFGAPIELTEENQKTWYSSLGVTAAVFLVFMSYTMTHKIDSKKIQEDLKQHVVKIIKKKPKKKKQRKVNYAQRFGRKTVKTKVSKRNVNRLGALAALGSLKKSNQRGGLDLGAAKTTRGPGLGGTQGSGGVQTSIYGKGIASAPVGAGSNLQGGGGYGTKGKGGGRAGYGQLSLVGSVGTGLIPLGKEAIIQGGLDRDSIDAVIRRNMGQVRFCYEQGLQTDPKLAGRVAVSFTIGGNGQVKVAKLKNTTMNSKIVEGCILRRLQSWKFPLPEGGVDVKVSYPFSLRRVGRG